MIILSSRVQILLFGSIYILLNLSPVLSLRLIRLHHISVTPLNPTKAIVGLLDPPPHTHTQAAGKILDTLTDGIFLLVDAVLSAIILCDYLFGKTLGKKKWKRKMVMITDAAASTSWQGSKSQRDRMKDDDVELTVVWVDTIT